MSTDETPCVQSDNDGKDYSSVACTAECFAPLYQSILNCTPFEATVQGVEYHSRKLCNYFEDHFESWWAMDELFLKQKDVVRELPEAKACYKKCKYLCGRTTYQSYKQTAFTSADLSPSITKAFAVDNMTFLHVIIEHAALYEGGIMTTKKLVHFPLPHWSATLAARWVYSLVVP